MLSLGYRHFLPDYLVKGVKTGKYMEEGVV